MAVQSPLTASRQNVPDGLGKLMLGAIGIVFGDIGTSVLYAFEEVFSGPHDIGQTEPRVLGAVSLMFWTLTLIVSVKYVLIVMRADNDGEGGIMALTALTRRIGGMSARTLKVLAALGVVGAALFFGDGMITPAVSVLSAVEGVELAAPGLQTFVVPIAVGIIVVLFSAQKFGTGRVGAAFGPIMLLWFAVIAVLGAVSIVRTPDVLVAISPTHAASLFVTEPMVAFLSLGSVVLCVTGAEALYADMGHFGAGPIRLSWFTVVVVALYINYFGQAALVLRQPEAVSDPFYLLVPDGLLWPVIVLATMATVIASQAVLSGAFSMTEQAIKLHYLPRLTIKHTSAKQRGQIYVPFVNWALFVCVVGLIIGFRDSSRLSSAYGLAVTGTFLITTVMITVVAHHVWRTPKWLLVPVAVVFVIIDSAFFAANMTKFTHGGWFPLLIAAILFTVFMTWSKGLALLRDRMHSKAMSESEAASLLNNRKAVTLPGTAIFVTGDTRVPLAFSEYLHHGGAAREHTVHLALLVQNVPEVPVEEQVTWIEITDDFARLELRYGFMQNLEGPQVLDSIRAQGIPVAHDETIVVFHSSRVLAGDTPGLAQWRKKLFAYLIRNSAVPSVVATMPADTVMEWSSLTRL